MAYISALDEFLRSEQDFWPGLRTFLNATFSLTTEKSGYGIWDMVERKMFHFPSLCREFWPILYSGNESNLSRDRKFSQHVADVAKYSDHVRVVKSSWWIRLRIANIKAFNPPRLQILTIDSKGIMIDDVITRGAWRHWCKNTFVDADRHEFAMTQNAWKRCYWHCNI